MPSNTPSDNTPSNLQSLGPFPVSYIPDPATAALTITQSGTTYGPYPASVSQFSGGYGLSIVTSDAIGAGPITVQPGAWPSPQADPAQFSSAGFAAVTGGSLSGPFVPVPEGGSVPSGAAALPAPYGLANGYSSGDAPLASDFDLLSSLAQNGLAGALAAIGTGTVVGGTFGQASGLSLPVTAWRGILPASSARAGFAAGSASAQTLTVPASSSFTVFAAPLAASLPGGAAYDTAESGAAQFAVSADGSVPDEGLALFSGTSSSTDISGLTDLRVLVGAAVQQAIAAINATLAAVEAAIGAAYFPANGSTAVAPAAVASRLSALEVAGQGGPTAGIVVFWDALMRTGANPQTIAAYVASQLPPAQPAPTPAPLVVDVECVNTLKAFGMIADLGYAQVQGGTLTNAALIASLATAVDVYFYDPRIHGLDPTKIDVAHTTAAIDLISGYVG